MFGPERLRLLHCLVRKQRLELEGRTGRQQAVRAMCSWQP